MYHVTVNWLALYRYGMDFGNMGSCPIWGLPPVLSPDSALRYPGSSPGPRWEHAMWVSPSP